MTPAAALAALTIACAQGLDATAPLQVYLASGAALPAGLDCTTSTLRLTEPGRRLVVPSTTTLRLACHTPGPLLLITGDYASLEGGHYDGQADCQPTHNQFGGGIITVWAHGVTVEGVRVTNAASSAIHVEGVHDVTIRRNQTVGSRGRSIVVANGASRPTIHDNRILTSRHDGISVLVNVPGASIAGNVIDYSDTTTWATEPWGDSCAYAQGIVVWDSHDNRDPGSRGAVAAGNVVIGPKAPRPGCHLFIPISLAADGAIARGNAIDGGAGGAEYALEMAHANHLTAEGNYITSCKTCMSLLGGSDLLQPGEGDAYVGFRAFGNWIDGGDHQGVLIQGAVNGVRLEGNTIQGTATPIRVVEYNGSPRGVEVVE
jgi:hypothetical protein